MNYCSIKKEDFYEEKQKKRFTGNTNSTSKGWLIQG